MTRLLTQETTEPVRGGRLWYLAEVEAQIAVPSRYDVTLYDVCFAEPTYLSIRKPDYNGRMVPQADIQAGGETAFWRVNFVGPRGGSKGRVEVETLREALESALEWLER